MTVPAYKNIGFFFLQPFAGSVVVAWGIATDVSYPDLYAV